jgi:nicotinamidase-related amidase
MTWPHYLKEISYYNVRKACPDAGKCALLVINMQKYFLPIASPILGNVLSIIDGCRSRGMRVIFTRHGHRDISEEGGMLAEWLGESIQYGSKDWGLMDTFLFRNKDEILDKNRYSAFHGAGLDDRPRSKRIREFSARGFDRLWIPAPNQRRGQVWPGMTNSEFSAISYNQEK